MFRFLIGALAAGVCLFGASAEAQTAQARPAFQNFHVAIYVVVGSMRRLADRAVFDREFDRVSRQVHFDKVYLEVYRDRNLATDAEVEAVSSYFRARGIEVSGGVTLAAGGNAGQFGTFDYQLPADAAECRRAVETAARHFNEVILDDFFFYTSKSDADIAARGNRSWTQYRLDTMRAASRDCVLNPARRINPNIRMIIKYPNWYEHFQGLGYDLDREAQMFDSIYTGTETRDPEITDQLLQQYESYEIFRYFSNIRPNGGNRGGWVDTYSTLYVDRYAEQLWDTLFAKAPEITLFNWHPMAEEAAVAPGNRSAWENRPTSFNWREMTRSYTLRGAGDVGPGWARAAGHSLEQVDRVLGSLGRPIGIAAYKPYQSVGEDFLHNYLGNIGIPIELTPTFPTNADIVLLTESARFDPDIVARIRTQLHAGHNVVITSGLLRALDGHGIEDIVEMDVTGRVAAIHDFINGYGAGNGQSLNDPAHDNPAILFPEIRFFTNDAWPIIRGVAGARGFPILLMDRYSNGILYVLNIPDNIGDLYSLPQGVITQIKTYLQPNFPVRVDSPPRVSLFAYDNGAFVVESFRDAPADVTISIAGAHLRNISTGQIVAAAPAAPPNGDHQPAPSRAQFRVQIEPHSFQAYRIEN